MKKFAILGLIMIMLAVMVSPAMASVGNSNGQGNGVGNGHGNNGGNGDQDKKQDRAQNRDQTRDQLRESHRSLNSHSNQEHRRMRTPFYLQGTISAIDTGAGILTVNLIHGNARVKQYIGSDLTLVVTVTTQIFQITQGGEISETLGTNTNGASELSDNGTPANRIPITFDQLEVGQKVAIHGNLVDSVFAARLITVYIRTGSEEQVNPEP
ncbi:MAG: hypothetical protein A2029_13295 [Chloroflexi bacterium RBG_19FT_COMBO_47_9]|nr:MAG: hypothetical protein A2029_13295 [Chloroflexi bacterium RBG_19FT_COMBO_47_9]